ncbi:MAG TPA: nicotinate-nucleotide adenylyltransferase [Cycloclasticus sp.]|jgi:nicotinate-nucleotide adenylyltransferase|nr:nicotinate-nucleotide adenylyltransferase [Cycloclasticus sp.]HIL91291.1 nicotinate-nucleotide adenylyltransferase [Cycloclasticus sp.]
MSAESIGLYGGTFDPVHLGHLTAASDVQQTLSLDYVQMVLSANPPHKKPPVLNADERFSLLSASVKAFPHLQADDCEIKRDGPSYMVDTLRYYRKIKPEASLLLILGMEAFNGLMSWHQWQHIIGLAHIVVTDRAGFNNELVPEIEAYAATYITKDKSTLKHLTHGKIYHQPVSALDVSATQLRQRIMDKKSVEQWLVGDCWTMIQQHDYYTALHR